MSVTPVVPPPEPAEGGPQEPAKSNAVVWIIVACALGGCCVFAAIIAAIAIPNLLAARKAANEKSVIGALRAVLAAQLLYKDRDMEKDGRHSYARTLKSLGDKGLIDPEVASGEKYGYRFEFVNTNRNTWHMRASCLQVGKAGDNGFWVDDTGVIRICEANNADETDPPI